MAFKIGNTTAETGNASIDAFMTENKDHHELVKVFLQFDAEHNSRDRRKIEKMRLQY